MAGGKKNKLFNDIIDFFYSASIFLALWVWEYTGDQWLAALTFGASLGLLFIGIQMYKQRKRRILFESSIEKVDNMAGIVFEEFIFEHFKHLGYRGHQTSRTENHGADIVLQKDGIKVVVQTKRWKSNIGVEAIHQVIGAVRYYDANKGMVVTNSSFTQSARELAASKGIDLWDRKKLIEIMETSKGKVADNTMTDKVYSEAAAAEEKVSE